MPCLPPCRPSSAPKPHAPTATPHMTSMARTPNDIGTVTAMTTMNHRIARIQRQLSSVSRRSTFLPATSKSLNKFRCTRKRIDTPKFLSCGASRKEHYFMIRGACDALVEVLQEEKQ